MVLLVLLLLLLVLVLVLVLVLLLVVLLMAAFSFKSQTAQHGRVLSANQVWSVDPPDEIRPESSPCW